MFSYAAYGLTIHSTLELPELTPYQAPADATIHAGSIQAPAAPPEGDEAGFFSDTEGAYLVIREIGAILIRNGAEIIYDLIPGADKGTLRLWLLDAALATMLAQRGHLLLHASVVEIGGGAVAFLGASGDGKSTMAAALCARGARLLSDDVLPVYEQNDQPYAYPGAPRFKLWPDAATALGSDPERLPRLQPNEDKRASRAVGASGAMPLRCIYVLLPGDAPKIAPRPPREAFMDLVRHTYSQRWLHLNGLTAFHFRQCQWLVSRVQIVALERPRDLAALADVAALVAQDTD